MPLSPITKLEAMRQQGRSKFETLILLMCIGSGLPLMLGTRPAPTTLEAALHPAIVQVWGAFLVIGAMVALYGTWIWKPATTGLIIEEVGLAIVGFPAVIYAFILIAQAGVDKAAVAFAFVFGFGIACLWRYVDIWRYLRKLGKVKDKQEAQQEQGEANG